MLFRSRWVVGHRDGRHVLLENGEVVFADGAIVFVGHGFAGEVARRIDYGEALVGPGFVDLDALADLDTTILAYDNQPAWRKGRIWPRSYIAAGPVEMYSAEELAFQKRHAFAQLIRNPAFGDADKPLQSSPRGRYVIMSSGKDGIFFETGDGSHKILPTEARQVFDVTGAGDTVVAVLTYCRTCGVSLEDSLRLANCAAGITVGKFGTWAPSRQEILAMLGQRSSESTGKILTRDQAASVATRLRTEGRRLVFTNGCFDILHPGHCDYLAKARNYGDALMVAVNTDDSVRRQDKAPGRPVNVLEDRMAVLAALAAVDYLVPFDEDTPKDLIEAITPHVLAKGEDWRDKGVVGREWVESHGGQVILVPLRQGKSTTSIVDRVLKQCR